MTSNFLQVGRTIKCGHCTSGVFEGFLDPCPCICHDSACTCGYEEARGKKCKFCIRNPKDKAVFPEKECFCGNEYEGHIHLKKKKHICCNGECHHDDCCGKVPENCPALPFKEGKDFVQVEHDGDSPDKCKKCINLNCPNLHLEDMQALLSMFIDSLPVKGEKGWVLNDRARTIRHVTLFLDWCKKHVHNKKPPLVLNR